MPGCEGEERVCGRLGGLGVAGVYFQGVGGRGRFDGLWAGTRTVCWVRGGEDTQLCVRGWGGEDGWQGGLLGGKDGLRTAQAGLGRSGTQEVRTAGKECICRRVLLPPVSDKRLRGGWGWCKRGRPVARTAGWEDGWVRVGEREWRVDCEERLKRTGPVLWTRVPERERPNRARSCY